MSDSETPLRPDDDSNGRRRKKRESKHGEESGKLQQLVTGFTSSSTTTRVMVLSAALVAAFSMYWVVTGGKKEDEEKAGGKRVRFADEVEVNAIERAQAEEMAQKRQHAHLMEIKSLVAEISKLAGEIGKTDAEIRTTNESLAKLNGDDKDGYDAALSEFESENSLEKAFMTKEDIDKKRKGLMDLTKELGLHRGYLQQVHNTTVSKAKHMDEQYKALYGGAPPPVRPPLAPTFEPLKG